MNPVSLLRSVVGMTQQALAVKGGTSQPTIALYESGTKSPTVATLQRLSQSLGFELIVSYVPQLTREDCRSLAYHHEVAKILRQHPTSTIKRAKRTLTKMSKDHPGVKTLFDRWRVWLNLPTEELIPQILDAGVMARDMRQVTPFAGLLEPKDRVRILKKFRKEYNS